MPMAPSPGAPVPLPSCAASCAAVITGPITPLAAMQENPLNPREDAGAANPLSSPREGAGAAELAATVEATPNVSLDRSGDPLGPQGLLELAPALAADQITQLSLARCSVGREWDGQWKYTVRGLIPLAQIRTLVSLDLSQNDLEADAVGTLARGFVGVREEATSSSTTLKTLILNGNYSIGNDGTFERVVRRPANAGPP